MTNNKKVLDFVKETEKLCRPSSVVWIDGSEEQLDGLREQAVREKILIKLNQIGTVSETIDAINLNLPIDIISIFTARR